MAAEDIATLQYVFVLRGLMVVIAAAGFAQRVVVGERPQVHLTEKKPNVRTGGIALLENANASGGLGAVHVN